VGLPLLPGTGFNIQVVAGRLYWTALPRGADGGDPPRGPTQVRSVGLAGRPVNVRTVAGVWVMSAWPWLVTAPDIDTPPGRYNLQHRTAEPAAAPPGYRQVTCGLAWCYASGDPGAQVLRPTAPTHTRSADQTPNRSPHRLPWRSGTCRC
jgi:hypothetical protein